MGIHAFWFAIEISRPERPQHELAVVALRIPAKSVNAAMLTHPVASRDMVTLRTPSKACIYGLCARKIPLLALGNLEKLVGIGIGGNCTHVQ